LIDGIKMKLKISFLGLLCTFLGVSMTGNAKMMNSIDMDSIQLNKKIVTAGLKVGDMVPDVRIAGITHYKTTEARLLDFRGKLLILDFWATWCAPCRAMVPVMDSLQRQFGDQVQFMSVTYESAAVVEPVLTALRRPGHSESLLPEVTGDRLLSKLFPHRELPHYVWIGSDGRVRAFTEFKEVNAKNIKAMLDNEKTAFREKVDMVTPYDHTRPLLADGNGGNGASLKYHSVLTGYIPGLHGGMSVSAYDPVKGQLFSVRNSPLVWLYRLAYGEGVKWFPDSRIKLLTADSSRMNSNQNGQAYVDWLKAGNGWCYELLAPPEMTGKTFVFMQDELSRLFPRYRVNVQEIETPCLALVRIPGRDELRSAGGNYQVDITPFSCTLQNATLKQLVMRLDQQFLQNSPLPVIDLTGYTGRVDMQFKANLTNVQSLNTALKAYGLELVTRKSKVPMLVIRDAVIADTKL
jgi:thiol-disulfide isomerase/thioredoxin